ncbi:MAG: hypothetical protein BVN35_19765 [Proteobacteria bacterium ST_bin11]|nr:MAG: hypothetical protein BVN35_19765 [Proteobacteria bacterium ST_bin11]
MKIFRTEPSKSLILVDVMQMRDVNFIGVIAIIGVVRPIVIIGRRNNAAGGCNRSAENAS